MCAQQGNVQNCSYTSLEMVASKCQVIYKEEKQQLPNTELKIKMCVYMEKNVMIQFCVFVY